MLFAGLIWRRGTGIVGQAQQLVDQLATLVEQLWSHVEAGAWGRRTAESLRRSIHSAAAGLPGFATGVDTSTLGIGGSLVVVVVTGLCLAASPQIYIAGTLRLLPPAWRLRGREVLREIGRDLRLWCLGQLVDMAVVTLLVGVGCSPWACRWHLRLRCSPVCSISLRTSVRSPGPCRPCSSRWRNRRRLRYGWRRCS